MIQGSKPGRSLRVEGLSILFFCCAVFLTSMNIYAQDDARAPAPVSAGLPPVENYRQELGKIVVPEEEFFAHDWDTRARFMPTRGASSQSGKIGITDLASEYSYDIKAFGKLPVEFGVGTRYIGIDNTTAVKLPSRLVAAAFGVETTLPFFNVDKTYLTVGISPSFYSDGWNFRSSSFCLHQRYFLIYQQNEKLAFVAGADVYPGRREQIQPILGVIYKPNERCTFNLTPDNPEISYVLNKKVTLFVEADSSSDEFSVGKDTRKDVSLNYDEMHAGAGLRYNLNKYIQASFAVGGVFNRSIAYDQDSLGKVVPKDGLYTEFHFEISI